MKQSNAFNYFHDYVCLIIFFQSEALIASNFSRIRSWMNVSTYQALCAFIWISEVWLCYDLYVCLSQYFFNSTRLSYYLSLTRITEACTVKPPVRLQWPSTVYWRSPSSICCWKSFSLWGFFLSSKGKLPYGATLLSTLEANDLLVNTVVLTSITKKEKPWNLSSVRLWL